MHLSDKIRFGEGLTARLRGFETPKTTFIEPVSETIEKPDELSQEIDDLQTTGVSGNRIMRALKQLIPAKEISLEFKNPMGTFTAYNPVRSQTDETPQIMASGKKVYEGALASADRSLPFGTKVYIPQLKKIFTVEDRMNKRYDEEFKKTGKHRFDVLMASKNKAKQFGNQELEFFILPTEIWLKK